MDYLAPNGLLSYWALPIWKRALRTRLLHGYAAFNGSCSSLSHIGCLRVAITQNYSTRTIELCLFVDISLEIKCEVSSLLISIWLVRHHTVCILMQCNAEESLYRLAEELSFAGSSIIETFPESNQTQLWHLTIHDIRERNDKIYSEGKFAAS